MKIGILQCGDAPEPLLAVGDYPDLFMRLLDGRGFTFEVFRVLDMQFPASVTACDGWLLTGSRFGVYEDHPFIKPLEQFIRDAFAAGVPVAGICFGHQIMAQALGGTVEKFAGGWSTGATDYDFGGETLRLNAWHQDQVITPPPGATTLASSPFCAHAALAYGTTGLSVQAHPEFDSAFTAGLIEHRGASVVPEALLAAARARLDEPLDRERLAQQIADFFHAAHAARTAPAAAPAAQTAK